MPSAISQQVVGLATATSPGLAQAGGYNILPAGIVFPYAGGVAPSGFLLCEGQELSKATYAALYAAIGDDYATQINPTTGLAWAAPAADKFRVPDYRGIFLRGVGTPSGLDAVTRGAQQVDKTKKTAALTATANVSSLTSLALNSSSVSGSATSGGVDHSHTQGIRRNIGDFSNNATGLFSQGGSGVASSFGTSEATSGASAFNHTHGLSATASAQTLNASSVAAPVVNLAGDNETRPINKGVSYIIKA